MEASIEQKSAAGADRTHGPLPLDSVTGLPERLQLDEDIVTALASGERRELLLVELDGLAAYNDRVGFEAGDEMLRAFAREMSAVVERVGGTAYRVAGGQFCVLCPAQDRPGELVVAISAAAERGDGEKPVELSFGEAILPDDATNPHLALKVAGERVSAHRERQRRSAKSQAQDVLATVLSARRPELESHIRAVAFRAISIGRILGLSHGPLDDVVSAARLQNIGLIAVPDAILDKPDSLTPEEEVVVREHPLVGAAILSSAPALSSVATLVRSSCEHFDGTGHPDGLSGEAIPLGSRIVAVCVAYTALTEKRPYRAACTPAEALEVVRSCAGAQFDPRVVEALAEDLADELLPQDSEVAPIRV